MAVLPMCLPKQLWRYELSDCHDSSPNYDNYHDNNPTTNYENHDYNHDYNYYNDDHHNNHDSKQPMFAKSMSK